MGNAQDFGDAGVNRRRFMRNAGAAAVVAATGGKLLTGLDNAVSEQRPLAELDPKSLVERGKQSVLKGSVLIGQVVSGGDRSFVIRPASSGPVTVDLAPNAHISKGSSSSLTAFRPGDEAVLLGEWTGHRFTAVGIAPLYREWTGTVNSRNGDRLETGEGEVLLTPDTVSRDGFCDIGTRSRLEKRPLNAIRKGDAVVVSGLVNQHSDVMTAATIGVRVS